MSPAQCRAGRALADLSQRELADLAGVGRRTVVRFENGDHDVVAAVAAQIRRVLEERGVEFLERGGEVGVGASSAGLGQVRRAARALLGLSQEELARAASVGRRALLGYEGADSTTRTSTTVLVDAALRERGIVFLDEGGRKALLGPAVATVASEA